MMTCPICGRKFNDLNATILENGNPACPACAEKEEKNDVNKQQNNKEQEKSKMRKKILGILICTFLLIAITGCSNESSESQNSNETVNKCGDTISEHYEKTRKCNAKDNERQNCTYSNCSCTCRPK